MMKIFVIGANGQIGKILVKDLLQKNYEVTAGIRNDSQKDYFSQIGAQTQIIDLESDEIDEITHIIQGYDKVIFTAGSGGNTGYDKTIIVDLDGAVKSIEASMQADIKHFILVSSFNTQRSGFKGDLKPYTIAKHYADEYLRNSNLHYTIVHPGSLTNDNPTGKVTLAEEVERGSIPRADVAATLTQTAAEESKNNEEFQVVSGKTPIHEAFETFIND